MKNLRLSMLFVLLSAIFAGCASTYKAPEMTPLKIEENINVCCAITMEPDEVLVLVDKLKSYIENGEQT